jgi:undecaprenyl diphosphate synthase
MILCLALSYGGRESIVETARGLAAEVGRGALAAEEISEELLSRRLGSHFLPPLDLMVRTSGELRLSNFLLWEAAYAELYFTDTLWPDFSRRDLWQALVEYGRRERRFGKTSAQLRQAQLPPEEAP